MEAEISPNPKQETPALRTLDARLPENESLWESITENPLVWVDWDGGDLDSQENEGFKHDGPESYLISPISEANLFSDKYLDCTGIIAIATDRETNKEVAFLSHQDPKYIIHGGEDKADKFSAALKASINEIKKRAKQGTLDIAIVGGNYDRTDPSSYYSKSYIDAIQFLGKVIEEETDVCPTVLTGPNVLIGSGTDILVDTQTRTILIDRSTQPLEFETSYTSSNIKEVEKTWLASS